MQVEECSSLEKKIKDILKDFKRDQTSKQNCNSDARSDSVEETNFISSAQYTSLVDSDKENMEPELVLENADKLYK